MKKLVKQLFRFGIVGVIAFIIDYALFALLVYINVNYLIAQIISFSISLCFNYIASTKWVFNQTNKGIKEKVLFIILAVIGLGINELLLYIGVDKLLQNELLVKLVATIIVMIYNFITRKLIIEKNN